MEFEWDEDKAASNLRKHGLSFETARAVFADANVMLDQDRHVDGEERWQAIGSIGAIRIVVVVHTYRGEENGKEIVRIISARAATSSEQRRYFGA